MTIYEHGLREGISCGQGMIASDEKASTNCIRNEENKQDIGVIAPEDNASKTGRTIGERRRNRGIEDAGWSRWFRED